MAGDYLTITLLTLKVAGVATLAMIPVGVLLGFILARARGRAAALLEAVLLLPMILPPVAVGLALLALAGPSGPLGAAWEALTGERLILSWEAAALASFTVALPLFVKAAAEAFAAVPRRLEHVALTLGLSRARIFFRVTLPLASRGLAAGLLIAFARSLGEFGATSLVAGTIPGRTETLALAIYGRINAGRDGEAWRFAGLSFAIAVVALLASRLIGRGAQAQAGGTR